MVSWASQSLSSGLATLPPTRRIERVHPPATMRVGSHSAGAPPDPHYPSDRSQALTSRLYPHALRAAKPVVAIGGRWRPFPNRKFRSLNRGNLMERMRLPLYWAYIVPM